MKLLKQFEEDERVLWLHTQALVAFRENGGSDKKLEGWQNGTVVRRRDECNQNYDFHRE